MGNYAIKFLFVLTVTLLYFVRFEPQNRRERPCLIRQESLDRNRGAIPQTARELRARYYARASRRFGLWQQLVLGRGALRCKIGVRRLSGRIRLGHRRHRKREFGQLRLDSIYDPRKLCAQGGTMGRYIGIHLACEQPVHRENRPVIAVHKTRSNRLSKMIRFKRNFLLRWTGCPVSGQPERRGGRTDSGDIPAIPRPRLRHRSVVEPPLNARPVTSRIFGN